MARLVFRKWGFYCTLLDRKHFKVKLLRFKRDGQLSVQYHQYRNELWLMLWGDGLLTTGTDDTNYEYGIMRNGDSLLVYTMQVHTFVAFKSSYVLEIQYGEKCIEDDIVRL